MTARLLIFNILTSKLKPLSYKILYLRTHRHLPILRRRDAFRGLDFRFFGLPRDFSSLFSQNFSDSGYDSRRSIENQPKINWRLRWVSRRNDVRWKEKLQSRFVNNDSRVFIVNFKDFGMTIRWVTYWATRFFN